MAKEDYKKGDLLDDVAEIPNYTGKIDYIKQRIGNENLTPKQVEFFYEVMGDLYIESSNNYETESRVESAVDSYMHANEKVRRNIAKALVEYQPRQAIRLLESLDEDPRKISWYLVRSGKDDVAADFLVDKKDYAYAAEVLRNGRDLDDIRDEDKVERIKDLYKREAVKQKHIDKDKPQAEFYDRLSGLAGEAVNGDRENDDYDDGNGNGREYSMVDKFNQERMRQAMKLEEQGDKEGARRERNKILYPESLEQKVAEVVGLILVVMSVFFLSENITGNVIGGDLIISNFIGVIFLIIGIVMLILVVYMKRTRIKEIRRLLGSYS